MFNPIGKIFKSRLCGHIQDLIDSAEGMIINEELDESEKKRIFIKLIENS